MKIIHISDVHSENNENFFRYLDENEIDLVIISGDITNFGPLEFATDFLNKTAFKTKVIAIPGNCDICGVIKTIEDSEAIVGHDRINLFKNVLIYGFGGSNPTPFGTSFEIAEDDLYNSINNLIDYESVILKENNDLNQLDIIKILLTHSPPFNTEADKITSGDHVGSTAIANIIDENDFDLNLCGHIHEAISISKLNSTIIANPGMLTNNHGTLITTDDDGFKTEIIEFL
ncbi:MAG: metallophosphoesterase [Methanobrevibacter sp.]|jgi:Icc-related predicted phosphoesterase|nr:metallophosphoesterase [Methanobrevibacter sp.]